MTRSLTVVIFLAMAGALSAQADVKDQVASALRTGNSRDLAQQFISNVDLTVLATSDMFSRAQAEQILRKFFDEHEPTDLTLEHEGVSKMGDRYYIGKLRTSKGDFRTTFFLKKNGEVFQVKQLRIETGKGDF